MTTFAQAVNNQEARTENGMRAFAQTGDAVLNLFNKIGSARMIDIIPLFTAAFVENEELAIRVALWARDIRGGAGERKTFRSILNYLSKNHPELAQRVMKRVPELGRWDDLFSVDEKMLPTAFDMIRSELLKGGALCAKWMPRQGLMAVKLRNHLGLSPKQYRKTIVNLSKTVEQNMCAKTWDQINYSHVPSVASKRYMKAFTKNDSVRYEAWKAGLSTGETKVNASALYPYDVMKAVRQGDQKVADEMWKALPNYVGDASILPMVDVSGSMSCPASLNLSCMQVAVSLGLYLSDKNLGKFKDIFLTFSSDPQLIKLKGTLSKKMTQMEMSDWGGSTNLHAAFDKILQVAVSNSVPQSEMPGMLLILSDMQANHCINYDDTAHQMIQRKYQQAGYTVPKIVFWNLSASYNNVPARFDTKGVCMVSGFSPAIMKAILANELEELTPLSIMKKVIMDERYSF